MEIPAVYGEKIAEMLQAKIESGSSEQFVYNHWFSVSPVSDEIRNSPEAERTLWVFALAQAVRGEGHPFAAQLQRIHWYVLSQLMSELAKKGLPLNHEEFVELLAFVRNPGRGESAYFGLHDVLAQLPQFGLKAPLSPEWREMLCQMREAFSPSYSPNYGDFEWSPLPPMQNIARLLGGEVEGFVERGDAWAESVLADLDAMNAELCASWMELFAHARTSKDAKPKTKWLAKADEVLARVGRDEFLARFGDWAPLFGKDDGWWFADREERNDAFFKGLLWMASRIENPAVVRALSGALRGSCKARGRAGIRSQKICNAALWALARRDEPEAVSAVASAKRSVKHGAILNTIGKTLGEIAARLNVSPDDLEELSTPDFGLEGGVWKRDFEGASLQINFASGHADYGWTSADGKPLKNPPARVKGEHKDELKTLKADAQEVERLIVAIKERLDNALRAEKMWTGSAWRERYLDHPLAGLVARRVIWEWSDNGGANWSAFVPVLEDVTVPDGAQVRLWHPLFAAVEDVLEWRRRLESAHIQQPWKQAHREIYILTDAERATGTYSNRFAAHILKQHQFNALCAARGWKNQLRLMVDDSNPPAFKTWPQHGIRAEFWIEGSGEEYGHDTNETGTYLRLVTDQVRFYPLDAPQNFAHSCGGGYGANHRNPPAPALPMEDIPPLVFSETMRDVDLFVGVSSIGNDESWRDGGPNGHFAVYWQSFGFGPLEESAKTRADVLSRLLPSLKIRDRARIEGRFLHVEGKIRNYKIHLGSGNILMEPNDQYLCIVPKSGEASEVFLPFEGDRTLAVIVSKALLLHDDDRIKDASIVSQIRRVS